MSKIELISLIVGLLSLLIALYQIYLGNKRKKEYKIKTWSQIERVKAMMRCMDEKNYDFTYGLVCDQFRDLLKEAVLLESNYNLKTIEKWKRVGKISSTWQQKNALTLLNTKNILEDFEINDNESFPDDSSNYQKGFKVKKSK